MSIIKLLLAIVTVLAYILNIYNKKLLSYALWIFTNIGWFIYMVNNHEYELAGVNVVYFIICSYGVYKEIKLKNEVYKEHTE